jgi:hypothetical protein
VICCFSTEYSAKVTGNPALSMNPPHYAAACTDRPATQTSRMFARAAE